jgi:hypothetical protein
MNAARKKAESLLYRVMDKLDPTGQNSAFYKKKFAAMSDGEFKRFMSRPFPIVFQYKLFEVEPFPTDIVKALKELKVPLIEKVNLPYLYKNSKGEPVESMQCIVGPLPIKKMKQFQSKKTGWSTNINSRDMRTGLLINHDKNGNTSDREFEALAVSSLDQTAMELLGPRADEMNSKNIMYSTITTLGKVSLKDLPKDPADSLSRNMLDAYLIGSCFKSNLITNDYHLQQTLKDSGKKITRES